MQYIHRRLIKITAFLLIAAFVVSSFSITYADTTVPQIIKVGLSYSSASNDNFSIKSDGGIKISLKENTSYKELFSYASAAGFIIRKDSYYNIVNNKETEINYVKGTAYKGELEGPYHIQIGGVYEDINAAKLVADSMAGLSNTVFLAYEDGWRVWAQLYLDEAECQAQIEKFKSARPELTYSVIAPLKKRVQLFDAATGKLLYVLNAEQDIKFEPIPKGSEVPVITYNTLKYRGSLFIKRFAEGFINVYNELPFEQYLYGVVPAEMPSSWHMEALKAQAVAARNYGILSIGKHAADGFDICNTTHCQVYRGFSHENSRTNQAVDETKGKVVVYDGKLITTYFHSSSGGRTENSENVWSAALPYLRGVDDSYGLGSPYDNWIKEFSKEAISEKLLANKIDVGQIIDIVPLEYSENGRVTLLEIRGTKGNSQLAKEKIRTILGSSEIRSTWYKVTTDADLYVKDGTVANPRLERPANLYVISAGGVQKMNSANNKIYIKGQSSIVGHNLIPSYYTFTGKGWGHGLGMSQYGAKGMAEAGFNFVQILEHYYTGAKVK